MKVDAVSQCTPVALFMAWGEALSGKSADYHYANSSFWLKSACLYHFFAATQKDFALFLYLCTRIRQIKSKNIKILYGNEFKYAHNITIIRSELSTL